MSELTEEQRALLVGDDARMEGYYVGFHKTGVDVIDQVLSAVAYAAKGAHSTDGWTIELGAAYGPVPADKTFEWLIQEAANDAAERLTAASADDREALGWAEAEEYADDADPSTRMVTMDDFMTGWRTAERTRRPAQDEGYHVELGDQRFTQAQWEAVQRYCEGRAVSQPEHFECDCVPNLGTSHCHACSDATGGEVEWSNCAAGLAPQPEPEYEYRCVHPSPDVTVVVRSNDWEEHSRKCPGVIERRVKAGAWERAEQEEQS